MKAYDILTPLLLLLVLGNGIVAAVQSPVSSAVAHQNYAQGGKRGKERSRGRLPLSFIGRNNNPDKNQESKLGNNVESCDDEDAKVPLLLKPWVTTYRAIPQLYLPGTKLDVAFTVLSALALTCVDYMSWIMLGAMGWPKGSKVTRSVAGSIATIFHSTCLVLGLGACLSTQHYAPSGKMEDHPAWWQDGASALIQFCTGYMIYDAVIQFVIDRWQKGVGPVLSSADFMFLGHHAATALYMTSARLCEAGHMSAMILMFTGEFTAPIMNVFRISRLASTTEFVGGFIGQQFLNALRPYAEYLFALLYVVFRILVGPLCAIHLTYDILLTKRGRKNVPLTLSVVWLSMCWGVILGSFPWIKNALGILAAGLNTDPTAGSANVDP